MDKDTKYYITEIESRISRSKAIVKFDNDLKPIALAYEAKRKRLHRAIKWGSILTWEEKSALFDEIEKLKEENKDIRQEALSLWHTKYPELDAPSFSPSAILKRISRNKPFMEFRLLDKPLTLDPELQEIIDLANSMINKLI